jgi:carbohydrate-selective porin OprB
MGSLSIAEPRLRWTVGQNEFPGRFTAGYWRVDGKMDCFDGSTSAVSQGFYGVLEQGLWRGQASSRERSFITFLQFGRASGDVSPFTHHLGGGASWQAPVASRPEDAAGAAATWVNFSSQPVAGFEYGGEFIVEGYYKVSISRHAWLVTDIQFLHHPGGLRAHPDVVVMSPRLVISF